MQLLLNVIFLKTQPLDWKNPSKKKKNLAVMAAFPAPPFPSPPLSAASLWAPNHPRHLQVCDRTTSLLKPHLSSDSLARMSSLWWPFQRSPCLWIIGLFLDFAWSDFPAPVNLTCDSVPSLPLSLWFCFCIKPCDSCRTWVLHYTPWHYHQVSATFVLWPHKNTKVPSSWCWRTVAVWWCRDSFSSVLW